MLSIVLIPLLAIGWLDPLEGLPLVVLGTALVVTVRLLSRVRIPRLTWTTYTVVAVFMTATIGVAIAESPAVTGQADPTVENPMASAIMIGGIPLLVVLMWVARVAILPMVAGLIVYTRRIIKARSAAKAAEASGQETAR